MLYRFILLLVLLVLPATTLAQTSPQLHWDRYDNIAEIRADGSVQVREQQELIVDRGPARGMTRVFETGDAGRLSNIQVFEDGQLLARRGDTTGRDPGTFAGSDDGQQATIRVNFREPNADSHSITIQYVINRTLVASNDRATFDWNFFWSDPTAPQIRNGSVVLRFPGAVGLSQLSVDTTGAPVRQTSTSNSVRWELTQPVQGRDLDIQASFPRTLLTQTAQFRSAGSTRPQQPNTPSNPTADPSADIAVGLGVGGLAFCFFILFFLFVAFMIIRTLARSQRTRGYSSSRPGYDSASLGMPFDPYTQRRRRRYGGWGGGFFPPIIITPPNQHHNPYDNNSSPFDNTPLDDGSSGGSSSWGDSGGGSSSWGDSGGGSSSWGDMGGGGGSSWGGGGDSGGGGGSGGGSFD